jgi:hypothetical protein
MKACRIGLRELLALWLSGRLTCRARMDSGFVDITTGLWTGSLEPPLVACFRDGGCPRGLGFVLGRGCRPRIAFVTYRDLGRLKLSYLNFLRNLNGGWVGWIGRRGEGRRGEDFIEMISL